MNPADMMKLMNVKNRFEANHPKFFAFFKTVFSKPMVEGTIIEISVKRPGEEAITTNIKVLQSDIELVQELQNIGRQ